MPEKTKDISLFKDGTFDIEKKVHLNFFDLTGKNSKTKGTSCKSYVASLEFSKNEDKAQIRTIWGATGSSNQTEDFRHYFSKDKALKEFDSIIKSKKKKGYQEIELAKNSDIKIINSNIKINQSSLHSETQRLINVFLGSTNDFVIKTLKNPLGTLSQNHLNLGRTCLNEAKTIVNKYSDKAPESGKDYNELLDLTNKFYTLIPHNLGQGSRGKMEHLLLNEITKITQKEDDLDTLSDAKSIEDALKIGTPIDEQYKSLNAELDFIDHKDGLFNWINNIVQETKASNHYHLGKIKVLNIWKIKRDQQYKIFNKKAEIIRKECGKQIIPDLLKKHVSKRNDIEKEQIKLYEEANIIPLFHGTRTVNCASILKTDLKIRPAGAQLTGALYGNSLYYGSNSTKSINYTSINSSYWAKGNDSTAYMFLVDCCLGNQKIAEYSYQYTEKNIKPYHSIWAKSGKSGIINDEFMLYNTEQHNLRYLIEFTCQK